MKTRITTIVIAGALLAGCGTKTVIVEATTPKTTPPVTAAPIKGGIEGYFSAVVEAYPNAVNIHGRKWIVDFGQIACDAIDEGMSLVDLAEMVPQGGDVELIGYMVRQAILNICPHNQWFIDAATNA